MTNQKPRHAISTNDGRAQAGNVRTMHKDVPTKSVRVGGTRFVYRRLGPDAGVPVVFLNHLSAVLDNWDPRVVDGIAAKQGHCYANCQASGLDLLR